MKGRLIYWQVVKAVFWKDLMAEWRSREIVTAMLTFTVLILFIFHYALDLDGSSKLDAANGFLWVALVFSGTIGLGRSLAAEKDQGCLDGLLLAPVDRSAVFFGKTLSNWFFMMFVAVVLLPINSFLNTINLFNPGLILVILLATAGYASTGTLIAALSAQTRSRDAMLPILLFPVTLPLIFTAIRAGSGFLQATSFPEMQYLITLLGVFDCVFFTLGWMFFDPLMEE